MKHMNRILALALALIIVLGLATTAYAATNDSITITSAVNEETYKIYKMFDLSVDNAEAPTAYSYTVNDDWAAFFGEDGAGAQYITIENGYVTAVTDVAALAAAAAKWEGKPTEKQSVVAAEGVAVFDGLENGYWLVTSTLGTVAMIETTPDDENVTIEEKNPEDTIIKEVKEDSTGAYGDENDAQVGDTVEFKSEATLYPHTTNVKIHDTMDSGLSYNGDVKIYTSYNAETKEFSNPLNEGVYTVQATPDAGDTFTISFAQTYLDGLTGATTLYLKYTAILNDNAVVKDEKGIVIVDQYNKTKITYGDKQSVEDQTKTTTHKSAVDKYGNEIPNLAGAEFSLKKAGAVVKLIQLDELNYRVATAKEIADEKVKTTDTFITADSGDIVIWGLDTDEDYTLVEIKAPDGYNKLDAEVKLEVKADNSSVNQVLNQAGIELPSTGGMGTTLFYAIGGLLVAAAVILLVTKKRMASAE